MTRSAWENLAGDTRGHVSDSLTIFMLNNDMPMNIGDVVIDGVSEYYSPSTKEHVIADDQTPIDVEMQWIAEHPDAIRLIRGLPINKLLPNAVLLRKPSAATPPWTVVTG